MGLDPPEQARDASSDPLVGDLGLAVEGTDQGISVTNYCVGRTAGHPWATPFREPETVPIRLRGVTCDASSGAGDGGDEETRTPDPLLAKEMLCRLSYVPLPRSMVGVSGLEPETSALSGQCSNQLS